MVHIRLLSDRSTTRFIRFIFLQCFVCTNFVCFPPFFDFFTWIINIFDTWMLRNQIFLSTWGLDVPSSLYTRNFYWADEMLLKLLRKRTKKFGKVQYLSAWNLQLKTGRKLQITLRREVIVTAALGQYMASIFLLLTLGTREMSSFVINGFFSIVIMTVVDRWDPTPEEDSRMRKKVFMRKKCLTTDLVKVGYCRIRIWHFSQ